MQNLECPNCHNPIGFIQFAKALTPWHLCCRKCNAKIKVGKYAGLLFAIAVIIGIIFGMSFAIYDVPITSSLLILLSVGLSAEVVVYFLLRLCGIGLELREQGAH